MDTASGNLEARRNALLVITEYIKIASSLMIFLSNLTVFQKYTGSRSLDFSQL
ncbi:hypothetical protein ARMSODRAFT_965132 [Armillaria solidipes]|uniref:Uncharacterized protein n=1 Tax=Armillaria solidipes TaxID=1076256 RepID=A0A2H3AX97_9AGAR|nr:hypothetical protein ARMSODRAFT_965132 [Armillaria solidipes]